MSQKEKDKEQGRADPSPPIMLSNLETNILENYGEGEVHFTQNTVPFDFDGRRLLWMNYVSKNQRDVNIFDFETKKNKLIMQLKSSDGLVSHMKLLENCIFYVKDTKKIIKYDMLTKTEIQVGTSRDTVIALCATKNELREFDKANQVAVKNENEEEKNHIDLEIHEEKKDGVLTNYYVVAVDESEFLSVYSNRSEKTKKGF